MVIRGKGRGKRLGFPTINVRIPHDLDLPHGIYGGYVWLASPAGGGIGTKKFLAAFHYGPIPTFGSKKPSLEAFALDARISSFPKRISFELLMYIRKIKKFSSSRELSRAIRNDVRRVRQVLILPLPPRTG